MIGGLLGAAIGLLSAAGTWLVCRALGIGFDNALGLPGGGWLLGPGLVLAPYLAVPSGLLGGAILGPRAWSDRRPRPVRLVIGLSVLTSIIGLLIYSLAAGIASVATHGPAGIETAPVAAVLGLVFVPGSVIVACPAAVAWVVSTRVIKARSPSRRSG